MRSNGKQQEDRTDESGIITGITVGGYKSLRAEQSIEVRPLTVLAGANSSGKSSMMQPLLLLKQTLDAAYDPGPLLLSGPNVKFTLAEQIFFKGDNGEAAKELVVGIGLSANERCSLSFRRAPENGIEIQQVMYHFPAVEYSLSPAMPPAEVIAQLPEQFNSVYLTQLNGDEVVRGVRRERCFLELDFTRVITVQSALSMSFARACREIIHLPGHRGNPERAYPVTAVGDIFPGTFDIYVASIISHWQANKDEEKLQALNSHLQTLGLTSTLEARRLDDTQVELRVGRLLQSRKGSSRDLVNIADVGFGVSQTVPVLVALLAAKPGQTVYLEQPEIHLHPRAQVAMAAILAEAARAGVNVVVETHSALLLRSVQTLVARRALPPELVKLHWFTRDPATGETTVSSADLDSAGAFGDWPEDFDDVTLHAEGAYLDAAGNAARRG